MRRRDRWTGLIEPEHRWAVLAAVNEAGQPSAVDVAARSGLHTEQVKAILRDLEAGQLVVKPSTRSYEITPAGKAEFESSTRGALLSEETRLRDEITSKDKVISGLRTQITVQLERIRELSNTADSQAMQIQRRDALLGEVGSLLETVQKEIQRLTRQRTEKRR